VRGDWYAFRRRQPGWVLERRFRLRSPSVIIRTKKEVVGRRRRFLANRQSPLTSRDRFLPVPSPPYRKIRFDKRSRNAEKHACYVNLHVNLPST
jgi:hypothetical protein